jgi:NAD(P)-dependent dehydrogenase (short-subunit alcohol dehydrogenase family)
MKTRHVVITGAAGGIGRALVDGFSDTGWAVFATDQEVAPADLRCDRYLQADLARSAVDEVEAERCFGAIRSWLDGAPLDALVNNAALQVLGGVVTLSRDDWNRTLQVNLLAPFFWAQGLLPQLSAAHGCVINVSSIHARLTKRDFVAYATSKAALSGMTRAMAVDLGPAVRVNAIEPAAIGTAMLKAGFASNPQGMDVLSACHPVKRIGDPTEVAEAALMLAGSGMPFMSGTTLALDGGISGRLHDPA